MERILAAPRDEAQLRAAYAACAARVRALIASHGRETVIGWIQSGLPPEIDRATTVR